MSLARQDGLKKNWWAHLLLIGGCLISSFPLLRILAVSLRPGDKLFSTKLELIPNEVTFDNYRAIVTDTNFFSWIFNSFVITSLTAVIGVCLAASAAYALSRYKFPMKGTMLVFLMATQMMPVVMILLPLYFMLRKLNLLDSYAGVIVAYSVTTLPFCVWLLKGYFDTIPRSLEEAAQVDGLTEVGSFWKVVIPLSTPSLAIAMLFSITQAWNEYIVARVVLQSPELYTWPLGLFELQGDFSTRWGLFAATSIAVTVPVTLVFLYSSKWLLSGLTVGGVKG
jgi:arabinogalactan oligomer/maltooligosaccharide transport system permease protein